MDISLEIIIIGALSGLTYAILGAGMVLVFRATRVINFAYGEMGAFGAAVLPKLVLDYHWNFYLTFALMLVLGGAIGAAIELTVIRRLFTAPRLILLVATIGIAQLLFFAQFLDWLGIEHVAPYPTGIHRSIKVGSFYLTGPHFMVMAFVPAVIAGLAIFLNRTPYGIAIRASAENADAARLAGISVKKISTLVWVLSGVLATATAVMIAPIRGTLVGQPTEALGPGLLLRALAAALIGRMTSLPLTLAGGIGIGIVEAIALNNSTGPGLANFLMFLIVVALVLVRGRGVMANEEASTWSLTPKPRPVPERLRQVTWVRYLPHIATAVGIVIAIALPFLFPSASKLYLFSRMLLFAMIGLSVTILTGWAGQLSLGQFAFVGFGALSTVALHNRGMPYAIAVFYATVAGVLVALAIGAPALRIRGLFLAVTTLAFAVAAHSYILPHEVFTDGRTVSYLPRGSWGFIDLGNDRTFYFVCLVALAATIFAVSCLRRSGIGRSIIAVRDNDRSAAAFTVSPALSKLISFAIAGGIAAFAGALLAGVEVQVASNAFTPAESLRVVAMTIIGGLGSIPGAVLGAVYVIGLPALIEDSQSVKLATSGIGLLILLMYVPGGLVQLVYAARDSLLGYADKRLDRVEQSAAPAPTADRAIPARPVSLSSGAVPVHDGPALKVSNVTVHFGGVVAVNDVTLEARTGEIVGLIGSNGAGKSTLLNVVSGFVTPSAGTVEALGNDITELQPYERARSGLGRVFQDARLFGDLTVREAIMVALEGTERSELVPSMFGLPPARRAERAKAAQAAEVIAFLGLGRYADAYISDLSTGTRRICELACLLALEARVLLLDEPTAGVAQRETEAFGPLIRRIQRELGATVVLIEHDMPLVLSLSDRVYCLAAGRVIAEGLPDDVRDDPGVVAAYLGTDERAIARSDVTRELAGERK
jgi:ABC-type branched-subunit amino acid transport system ATPase component/branched-subunit amino acid ABC-type transport system permease component